MIQWTKGQTIVYKTLHRKPKIEQHIPHQEPMVNTGAPEEETVPAPYVTPTVYMKSLAHLAKSNVSFCHHLLSVYFSHFNLL